MSVFTSLPILSFLGKAGEAAGKALERLLSGKAEDRARQTEIDRTELEGAPPSRLRLWRCFLGWVLALCLAWEVAARPVLATYLPEVPLPPSMLDAVLPLLLGMLGLGG